MANSEIIMYESEDGGTRLEVQLDGETVWLTQAQIAELFGVDRTVVTKHLKNIYNEEELDREGTCAKIAHVGSTGQTYNTAVYNLDAIISVGYRVNSKRATHFRRWATGVLRDYVERLDGMFSVAGRKILEDAGSRSHREAMEKAEAEYRKFQARTLSPVEQAYLKSLKQTARMLPKREQTRE